MNKHFISLIIVICLQSIIIAFMTERFLFQKEVHEQRTFINEYGKPFDHNKAETTEQEFASKYIQPDDTVLELGGRYGTVTVALQWSENRLQRIGITKAYILSVPNEKGKQRLQFIEKNFSRYKLPKLQVINAPDIDTNFDSTGIFHPKLQLTKQQMSISLGFFNIYNMIAQGEDEWCYVFEDDARVVNCLEGTDLTFMYVPRDTEYIRCSSGIDTLYHPNNKINFRPITGGGLLHASIVSRKGAMKIVKAMVPLWMMLDVQLPKCSCLWRHRISHDQTIDDLKEHDKQASMLGIRNQRCSLCIVMYDMIRIFEQTSNPTPPIRAHLQNLDEVHGMIETGKAGYAVHPMDWINEKSHI